MRPYQELRNHKREREYFQGRLFVSISLVLICFALLVLRLAYLQLFSYGHFQTLAEQNRLAVVPIAPSRGLILDRYGEALAQNFFTYTLEVVPDKVDDLKQTLMELERYITISPSDKRMFHRVLHGEKIRFGRVLLRSKLSEEEAARFAANQFRFPGVEMRFRLRRHYPGNESMSHLIGYIGRINPQEAEKIQTYNYAERYLGVDHIGKAGVEQFYERQLLGHPGIRQVEVNADGQAVREISVTSPVSGNNVYLTIDSKMQRIAEAAFGSHRGALVAISTHSGEVLSYVSQPGFNGNLFVDGIDTETWKSLNGSLDKPLINRPLQGIYSPGSTFKPFVALAGLANGVRAPPFAISDPGFYMLPGSVHRYRDWKKEGHGRVDIQRAVTVSCDTFFYGLANELGITRLTNYVAQFGFGKKTGIDIKGEISGLLPTPEWKMSRWKDKWYAGDTVVVGIGQGYTLVTPLQLAQAVTVLANKGEVVKPRVVMAVQDSVTGQRKVMAVQKGDPMHFNPEQYELVRQGMIAVTQPGGTAANVGNKAPYTIAAKTGTAQVIGIKQDEKYDESKIDERYRDHALFIAYAPADDPKLALAVIVENGGHGGSVAGPIARQVMDYYLLGKTSAVAPQAAPPVVTPPPKPAAATSPARRP